MLTRFRSIVLFSGLLAMGLVVWALEALNISYSITGLLAIDSRPIAVMLVAFALLESALAAVAYAGWTQYKGRLTGRAAFLALVSAMAAVEVLGLVGMFHQDLVQIGIGVIGAFLLGIILSAPRLLD
jgi:hypothetical protein